MNTEQIDLRKLNSLTKYPSIPTYHALGEKGMLLPENISFSNDIIATEKVDGTNTRILFMPDGRYLIDSREELLHASGDLIFNPSMGIVETIRPLASKLKNVVAPLQESVKVLFFEVYGGNIGNNAKQYTSNKNYGFRLFDIAHIPLSQLESTLQEISSWRENGGQVFFSESQLTEFVELLDMEDVQLTPRVAISPIPTDVDETFEWLKNQISRTLVALDDDAQGKSEGLVIRTFDRKIIAKVRHEDYARNARKNRS